MLKFLFSVVFCFVCLSVIQAQDHNFEDGGIYYKYLDNANIKVVSAPNYYRGNITLPLQVSYKDVTYSVTAIGMRAFYKCKELTSVVIPQSVTLIENGAFENSGLKSVVIPKSVISIEEYAFIGCDSLISVTIPNSIVTIKFATFWGCRGLEFVAIPKSVTSIGAYSFKGCSSLKSIIIPNSVKLIMDGTFSECSSLESITLSDSLESIRESTFEGCRELKSIVIPNSVVSIGNNAYNGCSGLTSVICSASQPPRIDYSVFSGVNYKSCTLYVPARSIKRYKTAEGWKNFSIIKKINDI